MPAVLTARRADGFELSDDPERLDVDLIHHWLSTDSYWAAGRTLETVRTAIAGSTAVGVYGPTGRQVAFARVVTDGAVFAYLCDVYVARDCRGVGLGRWMVHRLRDDLAARGLTRFLLTTRDAQGVYGPLGFAAVDPGRWMECNLATVTVSSDTGKDRAPRPTLP
jgi:ribosomal protein S18 acetylase RimI-like enzyme